RGVVEKRLKEGFIVAFTAEDGAGEAVDARIDWLRKKTRGRAAERRRHKRVVPRNAGALLILGADAVQDCSVKDMSASGAAVLAAAQPAVRSLLAIGAVPARVVRHFDGGFAVAFLELQNPADLEGLLTLRTRRHESLAARKLGFAA